MTAASPLRIVYFGSGAFGVPTFEALVAKHDVALVVTQPDRPAGRGRALAAMPVAERAAAAQIETIKPADVNVAETMSRIHAVGADAFVVIAFGQKLGEPLLGDTFAINLHGSLLPRHRGAAPVNWAILRGDAVTGVTVITLAQRMDAGMVLGAAESPIGSAETAGELHDRLALLGPAAVSTVLEQFAAGALNPRPQEEAQRTRAPKLSRADAAVRFEATAREVRCRINGLSPWPGCSARIGDAGPVRLLRVEEVASPLMQAAEADVEARPAAPGDGGAGRLVEGGIVRCGVGAIRLLDVQAPGGRPMSFAEFARGRRIASGMRLEPVIEADGVR